MPLLYLANNAIISVGSLANMKNEKKLFISFKDFERTENNNYISCDNYIIGTENGPLVELDLLLIREEKKTLYIESYEIKSSKRNNFFRPRVQNQLFKQSIFLTFLAMDGLLIKQRDLCILEDRKDINNYIVHVKYINGINENSLKNLGIAEKIDYISKNSYLIYDVRIRDGEKLYLIDFYGVFTNKVYYEKIEIEKSELKKYINLLFENYSRITKQFLSKNLKSKEKTKKSLIEIIDSFKIQNSYQAQE